MQTGLKLILQISLGVILAGLILWGMHSLVTNYLQMQTIVYENRAFLENIVRQQQAQQAQQEKRRKEE